MSSSYVGADLRRLVETRAEALCEYCLIAEADTFLGCEIDHIISEMHDGPTQADNLAFACVVCNQAKGSDVGSFHKPTASFVRLFNPRSDLWGKHFQLAGPRIEAQTPIGHVTAQLLVLMHPSGCLSGQRSLG